MVINDEPLPEKLIEQLPIEENLRPKPGEFREMRLGRSDRACLSALLKGRGRIVSDRDLDDLIDRLTQRLQESVEFRSWDILDPVLNSLLDFSWDFS